MNILVIHFYKTAIFVATHLTKALFQAIYLGRSPCMFYDPPGHALTFIHSLM